MWCGLRLLNPWQRPVGVAENLDELVGGEWETRNGTDRAAQIHGEVAPVEPRAEDAQECRPPKRRV